MPQTHAQFLAGLSAAPQDVSLPILEGLLGEGYENTLWHTNPGATDAACIMKDGEQIPLADFVANLAHAAPIFEKTHVGCHCGITVSGPDKEDVVVTAFGRQ